MPANNGKPPKVDECDIKFRNGTVRRGIDPKKWRWSSWPDGESDFDIVQWQPRGNK